MNLEQKWLERELTAFLESVNKYEIQYRGLDLTDYGAALAFAVPRLLQMIRDTDDADMDYKRHLIACSATMLGSIGRQARCAIPDLVELLKFRDWVIWHPAFDAIVQITQALRQEPEAVDDIIKELESILKQQADFDMAQRQALLAKLCILLAQEPLSTMTPAEWEKEFRSDKGDAIYYALMRFRDREREVSEHCRQFMWDFFPLSQVMRGQERLRDVLDEIKKKRRGGWQNLQEIGQAVQNWALTKAGLIKNFYLFGSRVREDFVPTSDLDIAIELNLPAEQDEKAFWRQNVNAWQRELAQRVPYKVDLHWLKDAEQTPKVHRGVQAGHLQLYQDGELVWNHLTRT